MFVFCGALSCSREQFEQTFAQVTDAAANDGEMKLKIEQPYEFNTGFVRLVGPSGRFPAVLQLTSYRDPQLEEFPSVYFRCETQAASLDELTGAALSGELCVQIKPGGDLWRSPPESPAKLLVTGATPLSLECEFSGVKLQHIESGRTVESAGRIAAIVP